VVRDGVRKVGWEGRGLYPGWEKGKSTQLSRLSAVPLKLQQQRPRLCDCLIASEMSVSTKIFLF